MDETKEDEAIVYVDFDDLVPIQELSDPNVQIKIIGIDDQQPIMQINKKLFKGNFDFTVGTEMFFQKDDNPPETDSVFDLQCEQPYKYVCKTNKVLKMRRLFVDPVEETEPQSEARDDDEEEDLYKLRVQMSYPEALNMFLPPGRAPPRQIQPTDTCVLRNYVIRPHLGDFEERRTEATEEELQNDLNAICSDVDSKMQGGKSETENL